MYCPVCESEYEAGITACPDDNSELVAKLTPENTVHDSSEAKFVALHHLGSPPEAEMVNDILTQNGIRSAVQSGAADALSPRDILDDLDADAQQDPAFFPDFDHGYYYHVDARLSAFGHDLYQNNTGAINVTMKRVG